MSRISWKAKRLIALLISLLPLNALRVLAYRYLMGYQISRSARIGWGTVICVSSAKIGAANILHYNSLVGPYALEIADRACIGKRNEIHGANWALEPKFARRGIVRSCQIGSDTLITADHFIDVSGGFKLGNGSWIAGRASQFWTHGAESAGGDVAIKLGEHNYIGSAARFAPGSGLAARTLVAMGSVVTSRFTQDELMIGGVPAKIIREHFDFHEHMRDPRTSSSGDESTGPAMNAAPVQ